MIKLTKSLYECDCTHITDGYDWTFEIMAMDAGEAIEKIENAGVFAVNDLRLVKED